VVTAFAIVTQSRNAAITLAQEKANLAEKNGDLARDNQEKATANGLLAQQERELRQKLQRQAANTFLTDGLYACERGDVGRGTLLLAHGLELAHETKAADLEQTCRTQLALWGSRLPALKMQLPHSDEVLAVAFSPDGSKILTGGADKTAMLWDATTGEPLGKPLQPPKWSAGVGLGRSGHDFAAVLRSKHGGEVVAVAFSPDGRTVAGGMGDPFYRGRSQLVGSEAERAAELLRFGGPWPEVPGLGDKRLDLGLAAWATRSTPGLLLPPPPLWDAATGNRLNGTGFGEPVWAVAFSPDGRALVPGGGWFQKGLNSRSRIPGLGRSDPIGSPGLGRSNPFGISGLGRSNPFNPLGQREGDGQAHLWDVAKRAHLRVFPHDNAVLAVAFSPDGRRVLTGSADQTAQLWDAATGRPLGKPLTHDGLVLAVAFSPDGRTILTCSQRSTTQGTVRLWNADTGQALGQPLAHPRPVLAAAFSPDGGEVLTGSGDLATGTGEAHLWAVATGRPLGQPLPHPGPVHSVAWSPDGRWVVTGCADKVARVWEAAPAPAVVRAGQHENVIAYSPDGRRVLLGIVAKGNEGPLSDRCEAVSLGETSSGKLLFRVFQKGQASGRAAFSPDTRKILLEFEDRNGEGGALYLVDATSGKLIGKPLRPSGSLEAVAVSPDGHTILAGTSQPRAKWGEATLWDASTGKLLRFTFKAPVLSVAFSPDGRTAATGSGMPGTAQGEARLWDVETGQPLQALAHQGPVRVVLFSPDGRTLASASDDHTARLWDVASGKPHGDSLAHNAPVRALAFSADGKLLLTGSDDQTAQLWEATTGRPVGSSLSHRRPVRAVAISGDGRLLATGSDDQTARLWEAGTGRPFEEPLVHPSPVVSVAFAADGRTLLTRSASTIHPGHMVGDVMEHSPGRGWDCTGRVWALPAPVEDDPSSVLLRAQVATGLELDAESRVRVIDAPAWRDRHKRLGEQGHLAGDAAALREWHRREARAAEAAGEWFAALWHLEHLDEGEPPSEELHARRGRAYALCNRWEQAIADLTKAIGSMVEPPMELWYLRGLARYRLNQDDKALEDFSALIETEKNRRFFKLPQTDGAWAVWFWRGQVYFRLRQMEKAITDLSHVIKLNPDHGPSWHGRGMVYAELGDLERAAADFAAAIQRPNAPALTWCYLAQAHLHLNDASGYRECCARALKRFGETEDPVLAASLAWTCSLAPGATADHDQVVRLAHLVHVQDMQSSGRLTPGTERAHGAALYRAGKFQEAITLFTPAMQQREQPSPLAWLFLAMAHQRLKHPEEAKKWLDKAREWIEEARRQKPGEGGDKNALSWAKLPWDDRLALTLLQREAEDLIRGDPAKP
jgi:WD40 repeat protein/tetratricopeptide (TPR) repeat protein